MISHPHVENEDTVNVLYTEFVLSERCFIVFRIVFEMIK